MWTYYYWWSMEKNISEDTVTNMSSVHLSLDRSYIRKSLLSADVIHRIMCAYCRNVAWPSRGSRSLRYWRIVTNTSTKSGWTFKETVRIKKLTIYQSAKQSDVVAIRYDSNVGITN